jgi:hypothetical protein
MEGRLILSSYSLDGNRYVGLFEVRKRFFRRSYYQVTYRLGDSGWYETMHEDCTYARGELWVNLNKMCRTMEETA